MGKTEDNLKAAFAGESQARNKYTYYAEAARKEGYHYIAKIFEETAENEKRHAKDHFKLLNGIGDTKANLKAAIEGEHYETCDMYPTFAKEAREEGNEKVIKYKSGYYSCNVVSPASNSWRCRKAYERKSRKSTFF